MVLRRLRRLHHVLVLILEAVVLEQRRILGRVRLWRRYALIGAAATGRLLHTTVVVVGKVHVGRLILGQVGLRAEQLLLLVVVLLLLLNSGVVLLLLQLWWRRWQVLLVVEERGQIGLRAVECLLLLLLKIAGHLTLTEVELDARIFDGRAVGELGDLLGLARARAFAAALLLGGCGLWRLLAAVAAASILLRVSAAHSSLRCL